MKKSYIKPIITKEIVVIESSIANSSNIYVNVQQSEIESEWQKEELTFNLDW